MPVLPTPVVRLRQATNKGDTDAFPPSFTPGGVVDDWGREFRGTAEIEQWSQAEYIGKQMSLAALNITVTDTGCPGRAVRRQRLQRPEHLHFRRGRHLSGPHDHPRLTLVPARDHVGAQAESAAGTGGVRSGMHPRRATPHKHAPLAGLPPKAAAFQRIYRLSSRGRSSIEERSFEGIRFAGSGTALDRDGFELKRFPAV